MKVSKTSQVRLISSHYLTFSVNVFCMEVLTEDSDFVIKSCGESWDSRVPVRRKKNGSEVENVWAFM